jgi:hypothetical protein
VKAKRFHSIAYKFITGEPFSTCGCRTGMLNLKHTCPKWQVERFIWHMAFTAAPLFLFLLPDQCLYIVKNMCKQYIHKSDHVETVYELLLLPNNTASETFLQKSGAMQVLTWDLPMGHWPVVTGQIHNTGQHVLQSPQYTADPGVQMRIRCAVPSQDNDSCGVKTKWNMYSIRHNFLFYFIISNVGY